MTDRRDSSEICIFIKLMPIGFCSEHSLVSIFSEDFFPRYFFKKTNKQTTTKEKNNENPQTQTNNLEVDFNFLCQGM